MPTKSFYAVISITAGPDQLSPNALSFSNTTTETFNKDSIQATYVVSASADRILYSTTEITTPLVYIYVQASTSNATGSSNELALIYSGSSTSTTIGKLKPGDWAYLPYSGSSTTCLKVNNPGTTAATITVIFAASGSGV